MKVSMVCGKFQRKKQRGGILLREQRSASVCILLLQNSPLSLAPCNTFQPQGLVFSGHNGRCSRNGRWGLVTRNAVILGGDCGHKQSQTHLLSRPYAKPISWPVLKYACLKICFYMLYLICHNWGALENQFIKLKGN